MERGKILEQRHQTEPRQAGYMIAMIPNIIFGPSCRRLELLLNVSLVRINNQPASHGDGGGQNKTKQNMLLHNFN